MWGCDKEGQSPFGIKSGKGYEGQEGFLQVPHQQKENLRKCGAAAESDTCPDDKRHREGPVTECLSF